MGNEPVEVFLSYSHDDHEICRAVERHLTLLKRRGVISAWSDRQLLPGDEWKGQIDSHLNKARIILLLVSSHFIASDYCYDIEMRRALERYEAGEACVIPVILSPVDWHTAPFGKLQALPAGGKPITEWPNQETALTDVAKGIRTVIEDFNPRILLKRPVPHPDSEQNVRSLNSDTPTKVSFMNQAGDMVEVYWLDFQGIRVLYRMLASGEAYLQETYLTHPWLITDMQGVGIALFMPERGLGKALISK